MGRSPCCDKNGLNKGPWTQEEDMKLIQHIRMHGPGNWRTLPKHAGLQRCGKSCRLRWTNYLRPDIKRGRFSFEEEECIIQLHSLLGNKWSAIAARLPGRTDNEIKNYWNTHIRKRLLKMGIDPVTHAPRLDLLDSSSLPNSPQLSINNLIRLQTLLNPEALRLALNLMSSSSNYNDQNPDMLLQNDHIPVFQPNYNQFGTIIDQQIPSNLIAQPMQENSMIKDFNISSSKNSNGQIFKNSFINNVALSTTSTSTSESLSISPAKFFYGVSDDQMNKADLSKEKSSFQSMNNQNFSFDSVLSSTPSSSSPELINSASTFSSGIGTENQYETSESFWSDLLKFGTPEISLGLDHIDDFMMYL